MNDIYKLWTPEHMPVTPTGDLKNGWLPGTIVYYVDEIDDPSFKLNTGTLAGVDKWTTREGAEGTKPNRPCGFLQHGVQQAALGANIEGDEKYFLTSKEPRDYLNLDNDGLVSGQGTGVATLIIGSTGFFKSYSFEKEDSIGYPLVYRARDVLYASDRGIFTKEIFSNTYKGHYSGYQVANVSKDDDGTFLIISNAW